MNSDIIPDVHVESSADRHETSVSAIVELVVHLREAGATRVYLS